MGQVEGKVAIVTGGASGIGAACAATLAREGAKVVVTDLDDTGGRDLVDKIGGAGGEAIFLHQDVSLEESWPGVIEATERRFGRLNVMVANAGIGILCKAVGRAPERSAHPLALRFATATAPRSRDRWAATRPDNSRLSRSASRPRKVRADPPRDRKPVRISIPSTGPCAVTNRATFPFLLVRAGGRA